MLAGCLKWRLDTGVEKLAEAGDLGNDKIEKFLDQQRSGKTYALGTAKYEQRECMTCLHSAPMRASSQRTAAFIPHSHLHGSR